MVQRMRLLAIVAFAAATLSAAAQERKDEKPFDDTVFVKTAASIAADCATGEASAASGHD